MQYVFDLQLAMNKLGTIYELRSMHLFVCQNLNKNIHGLVYCD